MNLNSILLASAIVCTALIAGLYYAYSCSVNPGLSRFNDLEYLQAMQNINRAIVNPLFFLSFLGALVLLPVSAYLNYQVSSARFYWLVAAAVTYAVASFGITIFGNVPLNDMLDKADLASASVETVQKLRSDFEDPWNNFHSIRTIATVLALIFSVVGALQNQLETQN